MLAGAPRDVGASSVGADRPPSALAVGVVSCTAGKAVPASDAWVGASLLTSTTERSRVSSCVSVLSREIAFDAAEGALVFE
jgi:hypothetical protein